VARRNSAQEAATRTTGLRGCWILARRLFIVRAISLALMEIRGEVWFQ
jgi:hypothetical protein